MWSLLNISAENFMSFEKVEFTFEKKCYVVKATNLDNDGQLSNGGGKTSFIDLIAVLLLGYSLTGRNVKDCVNWSSEESCFTISGLLSNPQHQLECYIERKVYGNTKSQELIILVNGDTPKSIPTKKGVQGGVDIRGGNAYILSDILDIKENDLLNYFLISKHHYTPFLLANTDKKLEVIARFSRADVVDKVISHLKVDQEVLNDSVDEHNLQISKTDGYIEALEQSKSQDLEQAFEENKKRQLERLRLELEHYNQDLIKLDEEREKIESNIKTIKLEPYDESVVKELQRNQGTVKDSLKELLNKKRELDQLATRIENYLAGLITCPKCTHKFSLSKEKYTAEYAAEIKKELESLKDEEFKTRELLGEIENSLSGWDEIRLNNTKLEREIKSLQSSLDINHREMLSMLKKIEDKGIESAMIAKSTFADEQAHIDEQIKEKQEIRQSIEDQLAQAKTELAQNEQWVDNFNDFKFYLGNKPIETICVLVNEYLKLSGSDLNLYIEGVKKLRSGELRQALMPVIYRNWSNPQSIAQFSEGERVRLNLATDLAFQQLINQSSKYGGLNLYVNDELISGLDSVGVKNAANAFNQLNKTILLVTHSGADMIYDNTIEIEKINGVSTIKQSKNA